MRRCFYLLLLLIFSIAAFGFGSTDSKNKNHLLDVSPTVTPTPVQSEDFDEIVLDKKVVCHPCPPGRRPFTSSDCDDNMLIAVSAVKPENNQLNYKYTVSGGRVIGEGRNVVWDMSGDAQPGTYQIRVDIENKSSGQKLTETETITVTEKDCGCGLCVCPNLTVEASKSLISADEMINFTANVSGGSTAEITYNWKVSAGEIIGGQGTPVIKVATNSKMAGKTVKATVEIGGVCEECPKSESAEVSIAETKTAKKNN